MDAGCEIGALSCCGPETGPDAPARRGWPRTGQPRRAPPIFKEIGPFPRLFSRDETARWALLALNVLDAIPPRPAERCRSGRSGRSRKPLYLHGYREFESHPLRQRDFEESESKSETRLAQEFPLQPILQPTNGRRLYGPGRYDVRRISVLRLSEFLIGFRAN